MLFLVIGLVWVLGTFLLTAFADPMAEYFGLAGHAKRLVIAAPTGLASLTAVFVYVTHVPTEGILRWQRFLGRFRKRRLLAETTVSFTPDELQSAAWFDERVQGWDQSGVLVRHIPTEPIGVGDVFTRLEYTSKLGRLILSVSQPPPEDVAQEQHVTLRLARAPHESATLVDLIRNDLAQLISVLQSGLGAPDGVRVTADFASGRNPFLGVLLRSGIDGDLVKDLRLEIEPAHRQVGDYVMITSGGMELRSGTHARLISLMNRYVALE